MICFSLIVKSFLPVENIYSILLSYSLKSFFDKNIQYCFVIFKVPKIMSLLVINSQSYINIISFG